MTTLAEKREARAVVTQAGTLESVRERFDRRYTVALDGCWLWLTGHDNMEHEGPAPGRFNYISNTDKTDVRAMMKEIEARISARLQAEGNA